MNNSSFNSEIFKPKYSKWFIFDEETQYYEYILTLSTLFCFYAALFILQCRGLNNILNIKFWIHKGFLIVYALTFYQNITKIFKIYLDSYLAKGGTLNLKSTSKMFSKSSIKTEVES